MSSSCLNYDSRQHQHAQSIKGHFECRHEILHMRCASGISAIKVLCTQSASILTATNNYHISINFTAFWNKYGLFFIIVDCFQSVSAKRLKTKLPFFLFFEKFGIPLIKSTQKQEDKFLQSCLKHLRSISILYF
jgi:hypothetical protein